MSRVWIISEYYFPNGNTTSHIMTRIAEGTAAGGAADVNVITSTAAPEGFAAGDERRDGVRIFRTRDSRFDKNVLHQRILRITLLGVRLLRKASALVKPDDTVLVVTNPATIIFLIRLLRAFKRFRLVVLVHDIFPENLIAAGIIKGKTAPYRMTLAAFNWAYRKADRLVVIGRDMADFMRLKLGPSCPPISFIPNFADVRAIEPRPRAQNELLRAHGLAGKFVVLFVGNIGRAQDFPNILRTMELLREHREIHLLIVGDGVNAATVRRFVEDKGLDSITLLPSMPRDSENVFLNAGDVGLVSLQKGRRGIVSPSKAYPLLAAGKPLLAVADPGSEIELMVKEANCGWWCEPGDPEALSGLVLRISRAAGEVAEKGLIARRLAVDEYSIEKVIPRFRPLLVPGEER